MTAKTLIFNFDGTGSEPRDAEQFSAAHFKEDASISNIPTSFIVWRRTRSEQRHFQLNLAFIIKV